MSIAELLGALGIGGFFVFVAVTLLVAVRRRTAAPGTGWGWPWRRRRSLVPRGPRGHGPPDGGVREPRRPRPFAGAGAAALPLPDDETDAVAG